MSEPVIAITMGDPAGIGPELVAKVLSDGAAIEGCRPLVVGDVGVMAESARVAGVALRFHEIRHLSDARFARQEVDVLRPEGLDVGQVGWGKIDPANGKAAALCLRTAIGMAMEGGIRGVVSAPLNKEAFHLAGYDYLDEVAYMADLTGSSHPYIVGVMNDSIWTVSVTEHVPFRDILPAINKDNIEWYIRQMRDVLWRAGFPSPRIAVAALNVHAGEGGLFGREEIDEIEPAIQAAQVDGIAVQGPIPADTVFVRALAGEFDAVVCMYHDQANIARKLQPMSKRATLYMGLPVVCGTTAHGTAFDIAGQGIADPGGLAAVLKYTIRLCSSQRGEDR
jgi:4-hydroxythreonine-4-phosphate dehydrogenase